MGNVQKGGRMQLNEDGVSQGWLAPRVVAGLKARVRGRGVTAPDWWGWTALVLRNVGG